MNEPTGPSPAVSLAARVKLPSFSSAARVFCAVCLMHLALPHAVLAQVAPGPYEILPFDDGFIIEAFKDLDLTANNMADWTGWSGPKGSLFLISPHPYDGHTGTDFSVQTGTLLRAAVAGTVSAIETNYARNQYSNTHGNFVRIAADAKSPNNEFLDLTYAHMLSVSVSVGQHVNVGDPVGYSDNTGQSDSEHLHFMTEIRSGASTCPFYWGHFKYPIMFNPTGTMQVGRVVRVTAASTPIRADRFDSSAQINTAWQNQLYFSAYPKRGYYQVFIPDNTSYRAGWIRATDADEAFTGTVIQPLPDNVTFTPLGQLATKYSIRSGASDGAGQVGQIVFGGGRFVADQVSNGYYRIPLPGSAATWGWVKPDNRMIVYPQLTNPSFNLSLLPSNNFPIRESFATVTNKCMFGRPKFNRPVVKTFSPSSPGGEGKALFVTDATNAGTGTTESATVGKPGHRNYYVQCDVYFNFQPSYLVGSAFERYGIFLRDDGFAGLDSDYEGAGNCYALLWDCDDGRLRAAKLVDKAITDFFPTARYVPSSGWHTLRIEARETQLKYFLDGTLLVQTNDSTFPCGVSGVGYSWHTSNSSYPAARGAGFDNFVADTLETNLPPIITTQPFSQTANAGQAVTLSVVATNPMPGSLSYQWRKDSADIPSATGANYTRSSVQVTDAAGYSVVVSNAAGAVVSSTAYLSVVSPLTNAPGCRLAPSGLADWWPADGNALDIFGSYHGTPQNGFAYAPGEQGLAFHFDGATSYLNVGAPSLSLPWTACLWVNRQDAPGSSAALLSDGTYTLKLEQYNGTRYVGVTQLGVGDYNFGYATPLGAWVHLGLVGTGSETLLYTNGVLQGSLAVSIPLPRTYLGAGYSSSSSRFLDYMLGSVDEIVLFNRALSASEINGIYSAGSAGLCPAPQFAGATNLSGGQVGLNLKGQTGKSFTIYASTNLANWTWLGSVPNPTGAVQFIDAAATNAQKFYRSSQP